MQSKTLYHRFSLFSQCPLWNHHWNPNFFQTPPVRDKCISTASRRRTMPWSTLVLIVLTSQPLQLLCLESLETWDTWLPPGKLGKLCKVVAFVFLVCWVKKQTRGDGWCVFFGSGFALFRMRERFKTRFLRFFSNEKKEQADFWRLKAVSMCFLPKNCREGLQSPSCGNLLQIPVEPMS